MTCASRVHAVATWNEVSRLATSLEGAEELEVRGLRQWKVKKKLFVWERPLRKIAKQALLADDPDVFFTTPHFDGYAIVLVRLDRISRADLREVVTEAWLVRK